MKTTTIDFGAVADRADLASLITARLGHPATTGRDPHWYCPFGNHTTPKLYVWNGGRRWRCWACGIEGGALDFLTRLENLTVLEAARVLDPDLDRASRRTPTPRKPIESKIEPSATDAARHDAGWQAAPDEIVRRSEANLWGAASRPARDWLRGRGLAEDIVRRFRLGFNPSEAIVGGVKVERGVTIPWLAPGAWYTTDGDPPDPRWCGVNVRRLMPEVD